MVKNIRFKISSGLKNLIGRELITDELIAIFELVKNSFDAHATTVTLTFENLLDAENSKITIADNGKGMSYNDLINKWLFVAYSAKSEGVEDSGEYRDKINSKRLYAGAKGVGRFSCDRLGVKLNLVTLKDAKNAKIENILVDWADFEGDAKKQFVDVDVRHQTLQKNPHKMKHGTVLEITDLRDAWDRKHLLQLKQSLAKLINPNQDNDSSSFSITVSVPEEKKNDVGADDREKVNGLVKNFLFETLGLKTTQIVTEISEDGKLIVTTLKDRGRLIYKITENSPFQDTLHDIKIHLFQLNRKAKVNFAKVMGMQPVEYGSIFLYKSGFRVYPFGDNKQDLLGLERRKQQGHNRYLGTRDLMGRIEINGKNENLKETTSRDGGLIRNKNYDALTEFFYDFGLKRLERYVVDVIKWGDEYKIPGLDRLAPALKPDDVKAQITEIVANLTSTKGLVNLEYDKDFLNIISDSQEKSLPKIAKNFARIAEESGNKTLQKEAGRVVAQVKELLAAKAEAEKGEEVAHKRASVVEQKLEEEISEKLFAKAALSTDTKDILVLQHQIDKSTDSIKRNVDNLLVAIKKKASKKEVLGLIERISLEAGKISAISQFVTKANFNLKVTEISADLVSFVKEYIQNVYREYPTTKINRPYMNFRVVTNGAKFLYKFRPLEVIIIIDNLFSNSMKAGAKNITVSLSASKDDGLEIIVKDDGKGIEKRNLSKIFDLGFTTTNGSGLGLYHVKQIVEKMKGRVTAEPMPKGAELKISLKK